MSWLELLLVPENLVWAWRKVRRCYATLDTPYDHGELAAFDLDLENQLAGIAAAFQAGDYRMSAIKLLPQPKKPDKDGNPRLRQSFQVAVRDQVAWVALVNALGPRLDERMPAWSYGNRLYRAAWYEDDPTDGRSRLNIGPYRHSGGHLYRHFKHSWPLFRRHISLTARSMAAGYVEDDRLDEGERRAFEQRRELRYLDDGYWTHEPEDGDRLYAASLDLKKFYPSLRLSSVLAGFDRFLPEFTGEAAVRRLVEGMLHFPVETEGLSADLHAAVDPPVDGKVLQGLPTGLFVSGFLANVAMLPVDHDVDERLRARRDIAHFRFVDDHEVLAYDFDALCQWIREYEGLLAIHELGVEIERDKYVPETLKGAVHGPSNSADTEIAKDACAISGRKPVQLMTRTLAQVSVLAGTDFDLLAEPARAQRLEQLEWLLLANIPEQEIRGDTRAAFAASRIAALTPTLFSPSDELVAASRQLSGLRVKWKSADDQQAFDALQAEVVRLEEREETRWRKLIARHYGLLFEAFATHPDKVRLFIRLFDYCRLTGHNGFGAIVAWMKRHEDSHCRLLKRYLGALAIHGLSRQVVRAAADARDGRSLHRQRAAAEAFLNAVSDLDVDALVTGATVRATLDFYQRQALDAFIAGLSAAAARLLQHPPQAELAARLLELRERLSPLSFERSSRDWIEATGHSLGVWLHWADRVPGAGSVFCEAAWARWRDLHDVTEPCDWNSLRRFPDALPEAAWQQLAERSLAADDSGWLFDAAVADPARFRTLRRTAPVVARVNVALKRRAAGRTLIEWAALLRTLNANDPRRGEWTALGVIRQLLEPIGEIGGDIDMLDRLHPANIVVPARWIDLPESELVGGRLTWEAWRRVMTGTKITLAGSGLADFRYSETLDGHERGWPRRLRSIGQLLFGLLRQSFALPATWNIRGQERSLVELVGWELERLPISSYTLSLLRACLLPRSRETAFMASLPQLFGITGDVDFDTDLDIQVTSLADLDERLAAAQAALVETQMTLLNHEPRQLIPVQLKQIAGIAVPDDLGDEVHA